jgi:hypothetical protein
MQNNRSTTQLWFGLAPWRMRAWWDWWKCMTPFFFKKNSR